jgi:hypothetical protein
MSDEIINHGHETEYEHEDLGTRGIFAFMIGLTVSGVIIYFIIVGMYSFLDKYERSQRATASSLTPLKGDMSRVTTQGEVDNLFRDNGAPMLETDERSQFRDFLMNEEDRLNSYGWVDQKAGVAHIPIQNAMDLIVQRGLPVYPQAGAAANTAAAGAVPAQTLAAKGKGSAK